MPHRSLRKHLNNPRGDGRTGDEKDAWGNLHKIELDRLLPTFSIVLRFPKLTSL